MSYSSEISKNDKAWDQLFSRYRILDQIDQCGFFEISARQINEYREARLMTKFDHSINLPKIFSSNNLAILPISRGSYIISRFIAYKEIEQIVGEVTRATFPEYIESIDYDNITSEATAINCAYVSDIFADFFEDDELMPTVSGRMSSASFSFNIKNTVSNANMVINVANSQLEIDGGYEGIRQLAIIEAKNYLSDDFLVRQLYYPYRLWSNKVSKKITPVFLVYTNGIFNLYEYAFNDPNSYNSLFLVKKKKYSIEAIDITLDDIIDVFDRVNLVEEPKIAFPQADNFERIINLCELLLQGDMSRDDITLNYAFEPRQTNYYTDAGRYLGLINKRKEDGKVVFSLTSEGQKIIQSKYKIRQLKFVEVILRHRVFAETLRLYLQLSEIPSRSQITNIMKQCNPFQVEAESTFYRRASTVASWINWILDLQR